MKQLIFTLLLLSFTGSGMAQNYLWPTSASHYLSSSFGEYRERHFHAGLDIKTWNRPGYKVYAVDDGYIWRVRVSTTGYGKVLYEKLRDGHIAVYAHLQQFESRLDDFVYALQTKQSDYFVDYFPCPGEFPVKRGEVIAYSGNTGTRYPHLHFEIRSASNEPINPLSLGYAIKDHVAPVPQQLAVTPLSDTTMINGSFRTGILGMKSTGHHLYQTDTVSSSGPFGLEIEAYDGVNDVYNKYAVYSAGVYLGDSTLFSFQYDQFNFSIANLVTIERDYRLDREGIGRFQLLYKTPFTATLPFYHGHSTGKILLPDGVYTLRVALKDFNGNISTIHVPVKACHFRLPVVRWTHSNQQVTCRITPADPALLHRITSYSGSTPQSMEEIRPRFIEHDGNTLSLGYSGTANSSEQYLLQIREPHSHQTWVFPDQPDTDKVTDLPVSWHFTPQGMLATVETSTPLFQPLSLEIFSAFRDTIIPLYTQDQQTWCSPPVAPSLMEDGFYFLISGKKILHQITDHSAVATQVGATWFKVPGDSVELDLGPATLFYPSLVWVTRRQGLPVDHIGKVWRYNPRTLPFRNTGQIQFTLPEVSFPRRQIGIYYSEDETEWHYLPAEFNTDSTALIGEILSLESFTLRRDSLPPEIRFIHPGSKHAHPANQVKKLVASVEDEMSGLPGYESIQLLLDKTPVIFDFNPITKIVTYRLRHHLKPGTHQVKLHASDAAGNTAEKSYTFMIQ